MKRIISVLSVLAIMAAMLVVMAAPGFADKGGNPASNSCGLGKPSVHFAINVLPEPGASDIAILSDAPPCQW